MHDFELARYKLYGTFIKLFHICGKMDSSMNIVGLTLLSTNLSTCFM